MAPFKKVEYGNVLYVGVTGRAQQGKSLFTDLLLAAARKVGGGSFILMPISQPMKDMWFGAIVGVDVRRGESLKGDTHEVLGVTHRTVLESLGDWGRSIHKHFWIQRIERIVKEDTSPYDRHLTVVLIPDVRLDDEAEWIRDRGGFVIHVESNTLAKINSTHTVETTPVSFGALDVRIINDGSKEDLAVQAKGVLEMHILGYSNLDD